MLGLQRGTVRLVPHDDTWPQEAARTIRQLREILGALPALARQWRAESPALHSEPPANQE